MRGGAVAASHFQAPPRPAKAYPRRRGWGGLIFFFILFQFNVSFFVLPWLVISQISFHAWQTLEPRLVTRWVRGVVWSAALLIGAGLGPSGRKNKNNWQISSYIHAAGWQPTNYNSAYLKP
jgi:hypothetical protein